jgi:cytochrome c556
VKRILLISLFLSLGAVAVFAKGDPIVTRENTMKGLGKSFFGDLNKMQKGQIPYDQATVDATFAKIIAASKAAPNLFPDDSKTGEKTHALPKIWQNKADFNARFKKLGADATTLKPTVTDVATLKAAYVTVNKDCSGCHQNYRAKEN